MHDGAERLAELAQTLAQASLALGMMEAIGETVAAWEEGEVSPEEALEEIREILEDYWAAEAALAGQEGPGEGGALSS